jgi:hypothetical protein
LKNGISPYIVNYSSNPKHLRCAVQSTNTAAASIFGTTDYVGTNTTSTAAVAKRQSRRTSNNNHERNTSAHMNRTMESLNYWKRAFNQHEPSLNVAAIPERFIRLGPGGGARKSALSSAHLNKEDLKSRRATPPAVPRATNTNNAKGLPKALLKTLSPIQNSPQFHNSNCYYDSSSASIMASNNKKKMSAAGLENQAFQEQNCCAAVPPFPVYEQDFQQSKKNTTITMGKNNVVENDMTSALELDSAAVNLFPTKVKTTTTGITSSSSTIDDLNKKPIASNVIMANNNDIGWKPINSNNLGKACASENDPYGYYAQQNNTSSAKDLHDYDDDLVFAIEI